MLSTQATLSPKQRLMGMPPCKYGLAANPTSHADQKTWPLQCPVPPAALSTALDDKPLHALALLGDSVPFGEAAFTPFITSWLASKPFFTMDKAKVAMGLAP